MIGNLIHLAAQLCANLDHYAPGLAITILNTNAAEAEAEAIVEAEDERADDEAANRIADAIWEEYNKE